MSDARAPETQASAGRIATTGVMLAIFSAMSAIALTLPQKAAFAPLLIGIPGALLCLAQLAVDLHARRRAPPSGGSGETGGGQSDGEATSRREWAMFAWLAMFTGVIIAFGFHIGGTAAVFAYIRYASRESWLNAVLGAAGTFATFWLIFDKLLELTLFAGLVQRWLF